MNTTRNFISNNKWRILLVLVILITVLVILPEGKSAPLPQLDKNALESSAMSVARDYGLTGNPIATKSVYMSLGEWNNLTNSELGKDASAIGLTVDQPIYVLAIQGDVVWNGPDGTAWWGGEKERFDNITIVLDVYTGKVMYVGSMRSGVAMPVPIP